LLCAVLCNPGFTFADGVPTLICSSGIWRLFATYSSGNGKSVFYTRDTLTPRKRHMSAPVEDDLGILHIGGMG
jgi:hypothetical protein